MTNIKQFINFSISLLVKLAFICLALLVVFSLVVLAVGLFLFWLIKTLIFKLLNKPTQAWNFKNHGWQTFYRYQANWNKFTPKPTKRTSFKDDENITDVKFKS